jgi:two-component system, OmpR family, response regulator MprA
VAEVLLVDDDPAVLSSLRRVLLLEDFDVVTAGDGEGALAELRRQPADLVILDVLLPGIDGFTVCERIRQVDDTPVLMISAKHTVPDRVAGLARGADDYLVKPFAIEEFVARVRTLLRRRQPIGNILRYADVTLDTAAHQAFRAGRLLRLSAREFDMLALFVRHPARAFSREELCRQVWGADFEGASNFIDVALKALRKKLDVGGQPRLIQTVRGVGYVFQDESAGSTLT